jgi:hypothetical protein
VPLCGSCHARYDGHAGETHHLAKLTEGQVREIRVRYAAGETQTQLAKEYPARQDVISDVVRRKTWKEVAA